MYFRSDHFPFARAGVPSLYFKHGWSFVGRPAGWGDSVRADYNANRYHQPSDEFDPAWNMSGPLDDAIALFTFGERLANSELWPNWREGNEFHRVRDSSRAAN